MISNGSTREVVDLLQSYLDRGFIHQLVLNIRNWGKIDAVLSAARGRFEELMTITDADVLFRPGWVDAIEEAFRAFPECGFVTPAPNPSLAFSHTTTTILSALMRRELRFESVVPQGDLDRFAHSIGRADVFKPEQRKLQMVVRRNGAAACVGGGHFVFTMRRELIRRMPSHPSLVALKPFGETAWFDDPPDEVGAWRLSTTRAYAYHMGNVPEPWMYAEANESAASALPRLATEPCAFPALRRSTLAVLPLRWRQMAISALSRYAIRPHWIKLASSAN